jgi:thiol-disulfide isomerase/thioredoxin
MLGVQAVRVVEVRLMRFTAPWCKPCQVAGPVIDKIAGELELALEVINIDNDPMPAQRYRIMSIPTVLLVDEEEGELGRIVGSLQPDTYRDRIRSLVQIQS